MKIGDLNAVKTALWPVRNEWKDNGPKIGVDVTSIDKTQRGDSGDCLREMLSTWLKGSDPGFSRTWEAIVRALREKDTKKKCGSVADEIAAAKV